MGFTRVDALDRLNDDERSVRLAPLLDERPNWTVTTEDRGDAVFLQLDETALAQWETKVLADPCWEAHKQNFERQVF